MTVENNATPLEEGQAPAAIVAPDNNNEEAPVGEVGGVAAGQQNTTEGVQVKEEGAPAPLESGQPQEPIANNGGLDSIVQAAAGLESLQAPGADPVDANMKSPDSQDTEPIGRPPFRGGFKPTPVNTEQYDITGLPVLPPAASRERSRKDSPLVCHIVGCNVNLAVQAEYYQRYRICRDHLRSPTLVVEGIPQRFCQQCGRFHLLDAFDGEKRNCRARLAQHNSRRRKVGQSNGMAYAAVRHNIHDDDDDFDPAMERMRRPTERSAFGMASKSYPGPGGYARHASDPPIGSRRPRDPLEQLYDAAAGVTLPPMLRSRPLDAPPPMQQHQQHSEDPSSRQHAMQSLLARFYSESGMSNNGPSHHSNFPPSFTSAIREVEAMLGRQVMQALLQEGGMLSSMPQQSQSNFLGLQGNELLKLLQRGGGGGILPAPFAPPPPPPPRHMTFGGAIPSYNSTPVHSYNTSQYAPLYHNPSGHSGQFPSFQSAAGNQAVEALRHLAATVPRSGYGGPGAMSLPPMSMPHQAMPPQQHRPLPTPAPVNPFSQHRDAMLQQLAAVASASAGQPSQSPEPHHQHGDKGPETADGVSLPTPSLPGSSPKSAGGGATAAAGGGGGGGMLAGAGPGPAAEPQAQVHHHQRNLSDEPGLQSTGMQQLLSLLRSQAGSGGGAPIPPQNSPPPPPIPQQDQSQLYALLQQMAVQMPSIGAAGTH